MVTTADRKLMKNMGSVFKKILKEIDENGSLFFDNLDEP